MLQNLKNAASAADGGASSFVQAAADHNFNAAQLQELTEACEQIDDALELLKKVSKRSGVDVIIKTKDLEIRKKVTFAPYKQWIMTNNLVAAGVFDDDHSADR